MFLLVCRISEGSPREPVCPRVGRRMMQVWQQLRKKRLDTNVSSLLSWETWNNGYESGQTRCKIHWKKLMSFHGLHFLLIEFQVIQDSGGSWSSNRVESGNHIFNQTQDFERSPFTNTQPLRPSLFLSLNETMDRLIHLFIEDWGHS